MVMMGRLLMFALAVYYCSAAPTTDLVVPENLEFTAFSKLAPTAFVQAVIKSGGTKGDCRTFATTTISTIKTGVQSEQATLDAVDTGSGCAQEGQTIVTQDRSALSTAQDNLVTKQGEAATALSAKNTACSADVDFTVPLGHLKVNSACYDYTNKASFTAAEASCVSATTASIEAGQAVVIAQAAVDIRQQEYDKSVADAADLKSACQCRVQAEQTAAWKAASAAAYAADWKQAHEVICTLDQPSKCIVPTCPTVTQPTVAEGVNDAACTTWTKALLLAPTKITGSGYMQDNTQWAPSNLLAAGDTCNWSSGSQVALAGAPKNYVEIDLERDYKIDKVRGNDVANLVQNSLYSGFKSGTADIYVCKTAGSGLNAGLCTQCTGSLDAVPGTSYYDRMCGDLIGRYIRIEFLASKGLSANIHVCRVHIFGGSMSASSSTTSAP